MGPINWLAAILSAALAIGLGLVWYGPSFRKRPGSTMFDGIARAIPLQALSALMLGHNYARLGADVLAAKPWLYWMQSGGIAIAFIIPALWISYGRQHISGREALVDAGYWLVVYLGAGTVFWALQ